MNLFDNVPQNQMPKEVGEVLEHRVAWTSSQPSCIWLCVFSK